MNPLRAIACVLFLLAGSLSAEVSYDIFDDNNGSRSCHISEEAKLHQVVHLLEPSVPIIVGQRLRVVERVGSGATPFDVSGADLLLDNAERSWLL